MHNAELKQKDSFIQKKNLLIDDQNDLYLIVDVYYKKIDDFMEKRFKLNGGGDSTKEVTEYKMPDNICDFFNGETFSLEQLKAKFPKINIRIGQAEKFIQMYLYEEIYSHDRGWEIEVSGSTLIGKDDCYDFINRDKNDKAMMFIETKHFKSNSKDKEKHLKSKNKQLNNAQKQLGGYYINRYNSENIADNCILHSIVFDGEYLFNNINILNSMNAYLDSNNNKDGNMYIYSDTYFLNNKDVNNLNINGETFDSIYNGTVNPEDKQKELIRFTSEARVEIFQKGIIGVVHASEIIKSKQIKSIDSIYTKPEEFSKIPTDTNPRDEDIRESTIIAKCIIDDITECVDERAPYLATAYTTEKQISSKEYVFYHESKYGKKVIYGVGLSLDNGQHSVSSYIIVNRLLKLKTLLGDDKTSGGDKEIHEENLQKFKERYKIVFDAGQKLFKVLEESDRKLTVDEIDRMLLLKSKISIPHNINQARKMRKGNNFVTKAYMPSDDIQPLKKTMISINENIIKDDIQIKLPKINDLKLYTYISPSQAVSLHEIATNADHKGLVVYRDKKPKVDKFKGIISKVTEGKLYKPSHWESKIRKYKKEIMRAEDVLDSVVNAGHAMADDVVSSMKNTFEEKLLNYNRKIRDAEEKIENYRSLQDGYEDGEVIKVADIIRGFKPWLNMFSEEQNGAKKENMQLLACSCAKKIQNKGHEDFDNNRLKTIVETVHSPSDFNLNSVFNSKYNTEMQDYLIDLIIDNTINESDFKDRYNQKGKELSIKNEEDGA